jgi:L-fuconolactonase
LIPDFPIVDTHVHLWDTGNWRYSWLESFPVLNKPYVLADFEKHRGAVKVEKIVFLECTDAPYFMEEAEWVTQLAADDPRIEGIVAAAPLEKGDAIRPNLEKLAANKLVKGIRRNTQSEPLGFCLQPDFVKGVQALADYGFSSDMCIYHPQMKDVVELVRQCPNVQFILDHIGKPGIKDKLLDPWREDIKALAGFPNVWCKVSGLVTEADRANWTKEDLKPYIDHVIDCFGFDRVMYGGDWPVAYLATEYPRWVETLTWAVSGCSELELKKLFRENAIAFYRLGST